MSASDSSARIHPLPSSSHAQLQDASSFPQFLRLPTDLQHAVWSFAPRRALLSRYAPLCKTVHANTKRLVERASSRAPQVTKRDMHGWIARLDCACSSMRRSVLSAAALDPNDLALLYVAPVPPRKPLDPNVPCGPATQRKHDAEQETPARALKKLRTQSAADGDGDGASVPSIPILRESNVCDSVQRTPLSDLHDASVHQILSQARWVLSAYKSVWRASLLQTQRDQMERLQQQHEDRLDAGQPSDFDYCDAEDAFTAQMEAETQRWDSDVQDLLFELRFVLLAMLAYSKAEAEAKEAAQAEASVAAAAVGEAQAADASSTVDVPGGASIPASTTAPASSSRGGPNAGGGSVACLYRLERMHINDPDQDLESAEGRMGCRYTTHVHVFPAARSAAQEEEEAEREEQRQKMREKEREAEEEAERVRAMLRRMDGTEPRRRDVVADASDTPLSAEAALQRAQAEQLRLEMLAAFKGAPVPDQLAHKYSSAVKHAQAALAGGATPPPPSADASSSTPAPTPASVSASSASRAVAAPAASADLDLPYFFIATSHFRDEKRANNSRRSMHIR